MNFTPSGSRSAKVRVGTNVSLSTRPITVDTAGTSQRNDAATSTCRFIFDTLMPKSGASISSTEIRS